MCGCLPTEHERPEVVRRLGLALNSPGAVGDAQLLAFADLQILSRHIVPFTPARVKDSVLSESFRELHGLNKYYPCEICGDATYRGSRDFEKHFAEAKHVFGMKCLGITNSRDYHGITKIGEARALKVKIEGDKKEGGKSGGSGEQFEDREGNVLSKEAYEGLARQGLL